MNPFRYGKDSLMYYYMGVSCLFQRNQWKYTI